MKDLFEDEFNRSVGHKIIYLTFLFAEYDNKREPCFAWMKTSDMVWHRFYIDAYYPEWESLDEEEAKTWLEGLSENQTIEEFIEDELEEYEDKTLEEKVSYKWLREDILKRFDFSNKILLSADSKYIELDGLWCTQLKIEIEGENEVIWNEYGDKKEEELICNGIKI